MSFVKNVAVFTIGYFQEISLNSSMVDILGNKQEASFFQEIFNSLVVLSSQKGQSWSHCFYLLVSLFSFH